MTGLYEHGSDDEVYGCCDCPGPCARHETHRCELCDEVRHVDQIAEPWPRQFWCPSCVVETWERDEWETSGADEAELERVGVDVDGLRKRAA